MHAETGPLTIAVDPRGETAVVTLASELDVESTTLPVIRITGLDTVFEIET